MANNMKNITNTTKTAFLLLAIGAILIPTTASMATAQETTIGTTTISTENLSYQPSKNLILLNDLQTQLNESEDQSVIDSIQKRMDKIITDEKQDRPKYTLQDRIEQEKMVDFITDQMIEKKIPFTKIGFDGKTNTYFIGIQQDEVSSQSLESYANQAREMVGSETNLRIENGGDYHINYACSTRTSNCNPIEGGVRMQVDGAGDCTTGFKATYGGQTGFITAGHCADGLEDEDVGQAYLSNIIGTVVDEFYTAGSQYVYCDCAFIESSVSVASEIFGISASYYPDHTETMFDDDYVKQSGYKSGVRTGQVVSWSTSVTLSDGTVKRHVSTANFYGQPGDSGSPIMEAFSSDPAFTGAMSGGSLSDPYDVHYVKYYKFESYFSGISWGF